MNFIGDALVIGLTEHAPLVLAAMGFFLIYRLTGLINVAYSETITLGAYFGVWANTSFGLDFYTVLLPAGVLAGLVLWGTTPAMVSYAQQQFPKGAGLASAITMGLSWGLGGLIQAPITAYFQSTGHPQQALHAFIPCLALAAAGAYFLPNARTQEAENESPETIAALEAEPIDA